MNDVALVSSFSPFEARRVLPLWWRTHLGANAVSYFGMRSPMPWNVVVQT